MICYSQFRAKEKTVSRLTMDWLTGKAETRTKSSYVRVQGAHNLAFGKE